MTSYLVTAQLDLINARTALILRSLARIESKLTTQGTMQMATLTELVTLARNETTVDASIVALLASVKHSLDEKLAEGGDALTEEQQSAIDEVFKTITANSKAIADAVVANTPAAP